MLVALVLPLLGSTLSAPVSPHAGPITLALRHVPEQTGIERRVRRWEGEGKGVPLHPLELMFDTGSPALWVMDSCTAPQCRMSALFDALSSTTLTRTDDSWGMLYGAANISGGVASDMIGIGGARARTAMGLVTNPPNWGHTASGLIGFGPATPHATPPWWAGVLASWPEKRFGLLVGQTADWLSPLPLNTTVRHAGRVTLGGVDASLFKPPLYSTPANLSHWWAVGLEGVRVNGAPIDIRGLESTRYGQVDGLPSAMLDTGLSGIIGPPAAVERVYASIPGAFSPDGVTYFVPREFGHSESREKGGLEFCLASQCWPATLLDLSDCRERDEAKDWFPAQVAAAPSVQAWCTGILFASEEAGTQVTQWILGNAFLQHNYVVHQFDPPEVQVGLLSDRALVLVREANIALNRLLGSRVG
ncbi:hypothetical protein CspeluHIS016_0211770 [Cutaneotrichosporon spelunceum]|uniref:Peptidase A1 domain-containing protein n=1 Tax=Cutaneotrichosporon spelunceum TaxID=1672016 RepID=A0AAD3YAM1_9TREE|nr:hypothetical protein CspeluHIS016_0211770 [Cutaneotrichosporon spelunceum]